MRTQVPRTIPELVLYRAALRLCPPAFRREHASEMLMDATEAWCDAVASDRRDGRWRWRLQMTLDLVRTLGVQWCRTGVPFIAIAAAALALSIAEGLASVARSIRFEVPSDGPDADAIGLVVVATLVICCVTMTIVLTFWTSWLLRRSRH